MRIQIWQQACNGVGFVHSENHLWPNVLVIQKNIEKINLKQSGNDFSRQIIQEMLLPEQSSRLKKKKMHVNTSRHQQKSTSSSYSENLPAFNVYTCILKRDVDHGYLLNQTLWILSEKAFSCICLEEIKNKQNNNQIPTKWFSFLLFPTLNLNLSHLWPLRLILWPVLEVPIPRFGTTSLKI